MIVKDWTRTLRFFISAVLFGFLMAIVANQAGLLEFIDGISAQMVQNNDSVMKSAIFTGFSAIASPKMDIIWTVILAILLWGFKYKIPAIWALCTLAGGDVIAQLVKEIVKRPRPYGHLAADDGFSFPSGHVFGFFILVTLVWILVVPLMKNRLNRIYIRAIMILLLFLVAVSRVYLSAHFPSDVIGAMLLAYAWVQVAEWLYVWLAPILVKWRFLSNSKG